MPVSETESSSSQQRSRRGRRPRHLRRLLTAIVLVLALLGTMSVWDFVLGDPGVGRFDSADGRETYVSAYQDAFAQLPEPDAAGDVATSFGTVRVYEWLPSDGGGDSEAPVLLLPGRASGVPMWSENLTALAEERRVISFDLVGDAGLSIQSVPLTDMADHAVWIHELLQQTAPGGAHLVGHSFGGAIAAAYALEHPEAVRSLTLLEPVFTLATPPANLLGWTVLSSLPGLPEPIKEHALSKVGGTEYDGEDPMARMIAAGTEHYRASLPQPAVLGEHQRAALDMPVYVAIAEHASLAGGASAVATARTLPRAQVEVWEDATHSLPMQATGELEPRLLEFFAHNDE